MPTRSPAKSRQLHLIKKHFARVLVSLLTFGFFRTRSPYRILGVSRFASNAQLQRSYHKLMRQYHPDKMAAAHRRALAINTAYEEIMKKRGLKKIAA